MNSNRIQIDELVSPKGSDVSSESAFYRKSLKSVCDDIHDALRLSLGNNGDMVTKLAARLLQYIYIEDINEIQLGKFMKLMRKTPDKKMLFNAGVVTGIKFHDSGCNIMFLNTYTQRLLQYRFDDFLFFQRLSEQEKLILYSVELATNKF